VRDGHEDCSDGSDELNGEYSQPKKGYFPNYTSTFEGEDIELKNDTLKMLLYS